MKVVWVSACPESMADFEPTTLTIFALAIHCGFGVAGQMP